MTTCKECKYYFVETSQATHTSLGETPRQQTFTNRFIECRRYPKPSPTEDDYWCGEFVGKTDKSKPKFLCQKETSCAAPIACRCCGEFMLSQGNVLCNGCTKKDDSSFFSGFFTREEMQIKAKVLSGEATQEESDWLRNRGILIGNK